MKRYDLTPEEIAAMSQASEDAPRDYSSPENVAYSERTSRANLVDALTKFSSMAASDKAEMARKRYRYDKNGISMNDDGEFHVRGDNKYTYRYDGKDFYANGHKIDVSKVNPNWEGFTLMKGNEKELPSHGVPNTHRQHVEEMYSPHQNANLHASLEAAYQKKLATDRPLEEAIGPDALLGGVFARGGARALGSLTDIFASPAEMLLHRQTGRAIAGKVGSYAADAARAAERVPRLAPGVERGMPPLSDEVRQYAQEYLTGGARRALNAAGRTPKASADMMSDPHVASVIQSRMKEIAGHPSLEGVKLSAKALLQAALSSLGL